MLEKFEKKFFVSEKIASELVSLNCLYYSMTNEYYKGAVM